VPPRAGQLQTSPFRPWAFDTAPFVLLRREDYGVLRAALVPVEVVKGFGRWRAQVNGNVVMMNSALLDHPEATDISALVRRAAGA
jgi:hypothetical protein